MFTQATEIHSERTGQAESARLTPHLQPKSDYTILWGPDLSSLADGHASAIRYTQGPKMNSLIDLCGGV